MLDFVHRHGSGDRIFRPVGAVTPGQCEQCVVGNARSETVGNDSHPLAGGIAKHVSENFEALIEHLVSGDVLDISLLIGRPRLDIAEVIRKESADTDKADQRGRDCNDGFPIRLERGTKLLEKVGKRPEGQRGVQDNQDAEEHPASKQHKRQHDDCESASVP